MPIHSTQVIILLNSGRYFKLVFHMLEINGTILNTRGNKRNMHKMVPFVMESYIRTLFLNKN